jgi:hypothetical protein
MAESDDAPADTTMMSVVHDALRRDLARTTAALAESPPPDAERRVAIGRHVTWMMDFLHHHHDGEDRGLWPLVRQRNPAAGELLDGMEADHRHLVPLIPKVSEAGRPPTRHRACLNSPNHHAGTPIHPQRAYPPRLRRSDKKGRAPILITRSTGAPGPIPATQTVAGSRKIFELRTQGSLSTKIENHNCLRAHRATV